MLNILKISQSCLSTLLWLEVNSASHGSAFLQTSETALPVFDHREETGSEWLLTNKRLDDKMADTGEVLT